MWMRAAEVVLIAKSGISNHTASGILMICNCLNTWQDVSASQQTILGLLCGAYYHDEQNNRAKPMFELASALFSIADANEFRFARFYIVQEVALAPLKSPFIVCGLSDTPVDCQSVAKTPNLMPDAARKKYSHFALKNTSRSCIRSLFRSFVLHTTVRDDVSPTTAVRRLPLLRAADTAAALPLLLRAP